MIDILTPIVTWWFLFWVIGLIFLPLTKRLFGSFIDKGYIFSKIIGIIIISYTIFVTGELHILPFNQYSLLVIGFVFFIVNSIILKKQDLLDIKYSLLFISIEELLFFLVLVSWSLVRGYQPNINGLEKFMDFGFVNSILRSNYFPPKDMWMTPLPINYYYFGHLVTAVLTKLSLLPSAITFNLMIATIMAFTFVGSFSLGSNLVFLFKKLSVNNKYPLSIIQTFVVGLFSAWFVTFAGNLHTLYTLFTPYQNDAPVAPWQLLFSPQTFPNAYWYPNATRFIYHTIHEFPMYSFVVSDLHGHVLDIPFVLLTLAILLVVFLKPRTLPMKYQISQSILLGGICGIMYMTNAWDGLIYLLISSAILLYQLYETKQTFWKNIGMQFGLLFVSFIVISLPFSLFFKPFASQIGINCAPDFLLRIGKIGPLIFEQGYCQYSPWWQLAILYGFFFFWFVSFTFFHFFKKEKKQNPVDIFVTIVSIVAFLLILAPEFVYLKDIYSTYFRANTMFKLCYQAFIILSLSSSYSLIRIFSSLKYTQKSPIKLIAVICYTCFAVSIIALVSIYPYFATNSYYNNLQKFHGLNGIAYLNDAMKGDANAINWITTHIQGQPVMVEAQGDSYTDYERISSNTGLPTIFGWTVHEWLWHGTYDIAPPRIEDVKTLYESPDIQKTKSILNKYHVVYVYIGDLERKKYLVNEGKFQKLGRLVYKNATTMIYQML